MALADDPKKHILHMFKMAIHDGVDGCEIFPDGAVVEGMPLEPNDRVYGAYQNTFFFTPIALIWLDGGTPKRLEWRQVKSYLTSDGSGARIVQVTSADGSKIAISIQNSSKDELSGLASSSTQCSIDGVLQFGMTIIS